MFVKYDIKNLTKEIDKNFFRGLLADYRFRRTATAGVEEYSCDGVYVEIPSHRDLEFKDIKPFVLFLEKELRVSSEYAFLLTLPPVSRLYLLEKELACLSKLLGDTGYCVSRNLQLRRLS